MRFKNWAVCTSVGLAGAVLLIEGSAFGTLLAAGAIAAATAHETAQKSD